MQECGLIIHDKCRWFRASPDGLVSCKCCGDGLVEIKSTSKFKHLTPMEVATQRNYHCKLDENNQVCLKASSTWMRQIQSQLLVTSRDWCDFVLYTQRGIAIERIYRDSDRCQSILMKCRDFYFKSIIPDIV